MSLLYKFNFKITEDARTSFTGENGHPKHLAKAMVDKPWGIDGEGYFKLFVNGLHDRIEKRLKRNRRKPLVHSASRANQSLQK